MLIIASIRHTNLRVPQLDVTRFETRDFAANQLALGLDEREPEVKAVLVAQKLIDTEQDRLGLLAEIETRAEQRRKKEKFSETRRLFLVIVVFLFVVDIFHLLLKGEAALMNVGDRRHERRGRRSGRRRR